jgi:hypothetical protein
MASGNQSPEQQQPRRNLTEAFEALCEISPEESVKEEKSDVFESNIGVSPTSVMVSMHSRDAVSPLRRLPSLSLAPDLRLNLSPYCIERISCYSIIHDINKEALCMAAHDPLVTVEGSSEPTCPLVMAGQGLTLASPQPRIVDTAPEQAVIDEEKWLLSVVAERSAPETSALTSTQCPVTFLQAMGEKEYDVSISNSTRTQLWKPSRSWWEAKSGKNPWIEPASHNKRWRYLWPLIHYHKFLHKCIKKLKRNGVDVKLSLSPVSLFLREEVCAVSDHLAAVSLFGSEEWMDCLQYFYGWTVVTSSAVRQYQAFVANLPLRSLQEPGDVDSPVLRNQIDETFLRTMAAQRDQMRESALGAQASNPSVSSSKKTSLPPSAHPAISMGPPPVYPRGAPLPVPRQIHGVRRSRYYPKGWYGWDGSGMPPQDTSSVHSELSANSYPQPPVYDPAVAYMYHPPHPSYYHPPSDNSHSTGGYTYPDQYGGWMDPAMAYAMHHHQFYGQYPPQAQAVVPETDEVAVPASEKTPFKYEPDTSNNMSPYWSHLDQATLVMGLATPAEVTPSTPRRRQHLLDKSLEHQEGDDDEYPGFRSAAPAPLLRQQYYGFDTVPPSPATQFMMSPQASFAYNYGYGFSPTRMQRRQSRNRTPLKPMERSLSPTHTVDTAAETESLEPTTMAAHE